MTDLPQIHSYDAETGEPQIHSYDAETGEYVGARAARPNPRRPSEPIVPALATLIAPPAAGAHEAAVFDPAAGAWSLVPDWRGTAWWEADSTQHLIEALGDVPPEGAVLDAPPAPDHRHDGTGWVPDIAVQGARAHAAALRDAQAQVARITGRYPSAEVFSWPLQAVEARTVLDGGTVADDAMIARRAALKSRTLADEATRVRALADAFEGITLLAGVVREAAEACLVAADEAALAAAQAGVDDALAALTAAVDTAAGG